VVSSLKGSVWGGGRPFDEGERDCSMWWRMMHAIRDGVGEGVGSWFEDNVPRVIRGGSSTYFWTNNWVGGVPLRVKFPYLFDLTVDRWVMVEEMARRGWEKGGGAWLWRRRLLA